MIFGDIMNDSEFKRQQQAAVERMREMNSRADRKENKDTKIPPQTSCQEASKNKSNMEFNLLGLLNTDKDTALIIGILLILMSEKSDKILLFALIYILM